MIHFTSMSAEQKGSLYAILSGFLYGFIGYFGLSAIHGQLSASTMLFWRFLIASVLIFLMLLPKIRQLNYSSWPMLMAFYGGIFFYGISTMLYFYASLYIGSGLSMVIFFTYPVIIMLLNYLFYGQYVSRTYYVAIFIILSGMILLIDFHEIGFDLLGICLGLSSAFFYACYIMSSKKSTLSPGLSTLMVCLGCMTTSLIVALCDGSFTIPHSSATWINLLGIGVIATVIPILLMLHGLNYISSEKASILSVLEPVFVVIFGVLLLGETLKLWHILGVILILCGALFTLMATTQVDEGTSGQ